MDAPHRLGVQPSTLVGQIIASNPGHGGIPQFHRCDAVRHPLWLTPVQRRRFTSINLTEVAAAGALFATDQKGCFAIFPTFVDIWAARLLADSMQSLFLDQRTDL